MRKLTAFVATVCMTALVFSTSTCKNNSSGTGSDNQKKESKQPSKATAFHVRQTVEQMTGLEVLTPENWDGFYGDSLKAVYNRIENLKYISSPGYMDFQFNGKVFDVCNEDPDKRVVSIKDVRVGEDNKAEVDMNYQDLPCYDIDYTLLMAFNGSDWVMEDVIWHPSETRETELARSFLSEEVTRLKAMDRQEISELVEYVGETLPTYGKETIFYNNPREVGTFLQNIETLKNILRENPACGDVYDGLFIHYAEQVKKDAAKNGISLD